MPASPLSQLHSQLPPAHLSCGAFLRLCAVTYPTALKRQELSLSMIRRTTAVPSGSGTDVGAPCCWLELLLPVAALGCARTGERARGGGPAAPAACSPAAAGATAPAAVVGRSGTSWPRDSAIARASCSSSLNPASPAAAAAEAAGGMPEFCCPLVGAAVSAAAVDGSWFTVRESPACKPREVTVAAAAASPTGNCRSFGGKPPRTCRAVSFGSKPQA